ncbi:MAG TPA: hypothetical protein VFS57_09285, partial [Gemmatimonadaceae bacterium]|nr:hypothetical protein [Gemmatimonadaceae bacterium]
MTLPSGPLAGLLALMIGTSSSAAIGVRQGPRHLRGSEGLARVYDAILDARFDDVEPELRRACPPAPGEACELLRVTAIWWRIQIDPDNHALDQTFLAK